MDYTELTAKVVDGVVTLAAIGGVTYLGYNGVTDAMVIGAVAGLGGYAVYKRRRVEDQR